jgi:TonB family protein
MMDEPAAHVTGTITTEDYPPSAIANDLVGTTAMEFSVGPDGTATGLRLVFSSPGGVFDRITESAIARFEFTPARNGGRTRACSGEFQRVLWQLPAEREDLPPPDSVAPDPERI